MIISFNLDCEYIGFIYPVEGEELLVYSCQKGHFDDIPNCFNCVDYKKCKKRKK